MTNTELNIAMQNQVEPERYTLQQVCGVMCDACKHGMPAVKMENSSNIQFFHHINGRDIPCGAEAFLSKWNAPKQD